MLVTTTRSGSLARVLGVDSSLAVRGRPLTSSQPTQNSSFTAAVPCRYRIVLVSANRGTNLSKLLGDLRIRVLRDWLPP
jgi:hypothetical protein